MLALGGVMLTVVGRDFFPDIDGGQIKLHVRAGDGNQLSEIGLDLMPPTRECLL
jgi:hypothetical protein